MYIQLPNITLKNSPSMLSVTAGYICVLHVEVGFKGLSNFFNKCVAYVCSTRTMKPSHPVSCAIQDHSFDALTNIVGLGAALLANQFYWWIDPVGAMVLAVYTIYEWSRTVLENAGTCCRLQLKL